MLVKGAHDVKTRYSWMNILMPLLLILWPLAAPEFRQTYCVVIMHTHRFNIDTPLTVLKVLLSNDISTGQFNIEEFIPVAIVGSIQ